jgi:protein ImuA
MAFSEDKTPIDVDKLSRLARLRQEFGPGPLRPGRTGGPSYGEIAAAAEAAAMTPGLHEVRPDSYPHGPAAAGFLCALAVMAAQRPGAIVWIAQHARSLDFGLPYGPGLARLGLDPGRVLLVRPDGDAQALWAAEQCAQTAGVAAVLAQLTDRIGLTPARRLHLAAAGARAFLGVLRPAGQPPLGPALTRWRIAGATGAGAPLSQWAIPRWRAGLDRRRDGPPLSDNILEWDHGAHRLRLGAVLGVPGPAGTGYRQGWRAEPLAPGARERLSA